MKTYFRLLAFSKPYRSYIPMYTLFVMLFIIFSTLNISFVAPILNILFMDNSQTLAIQQPDFSFSVEYFREMFAYLKYYLVSGDSKKDALMVVCVVLVISVFLSNLFNFLAAYVLAEVKGRVIYNIRTAVYSKLLKLHTSYFTNEKRGDIISKMTNDVQEIESTIIMSMSVMLKEPLTIIFVFAVLFSISGYLTLFTLIVLPVSGLVIGSITKRLRKKAVKGQSSLGEILSNIDETLEAMKIIQAFTAEKFSSKKFEKINNTYKKILKSMDTKKSLASPLSQFLGISVVAFIIYYGGNLVFSGEIEPDVFIAFILLFASVISPMKAVANTIGAIQRGIIAGDRIFEVLDHDIKIKDHSEANNLQAFEKDIEFKNVSFKYENKYVLKDVNFKIKKGNTVALVGPSGGGKSTIADLIPRFYDVEEGIILVDGINIKNITLQSLRKKIGIVTQDSILFNDTIFNNIAFGKPDATQEEVISAAKIANAHDFIMQTEKNYETLIGDKGVKLSGGQKQRINIARAILKNPAILILDEATSALDTESEKLVQEALEKLMQSRTSIVIAHRLSTIQNADEIIVIKDGEIVEQGKHAQLMAENGVYSHLHLMQKI